MVFRLEGSLDLKLHTYFKVEGYGIADNYYVFYSLKNITTDGGSLMGIRLNFKTKTAKTLLMELFSIHKRSKSV